ncbi:hypothetical protein K488DRAFT_89663 [Vararia minispora EC-137]|uniref:Uncharacterized protein n=1 Tax=Vararia minispora EC-137 TaxID=1314806 RepID=A0ACB8QA88_9AGAM|nr:hypothetical protein K488DRAFT_89663 [Vararia minispora EC-137]
MSDFDELDGYNPTTPYKPPPKKRAKPSSAQARSKPPSNAQARAGPSHTKPESKSTSKKSIAVERTVVDIDFDNEDEREIEEITGGARDDSRSTSDTATTNGQVKGGTKGNGMNKDKANGKTKHTASLLIIDESSEEEPRQTRTVNGNVKGKGKQLRDSPLPRPEPALARTIQRLEKQLEEVTAQREDLIQQMQDLTELRITDPERELQAATAQYEATLQGAWPEEALHQATVEELARYQPLLAAGKSSLVHFLSREAADAEKAELQAALDRANARDTEHERRIKELEDELTATKLERDAEIKRSKELQAAAARGGSLGRATVSRKNGDDPLKSECIRLYEAMTNLLITDVKIEKGIHTVHPDCTFKCVFTSGAHSLSFLLESKWALDPDADPEEAQIICLDKFSPQELDKESDEFIKQLDYFSEAISFHHEQVSIMFSDMQRLVGSSPTPDMDISAEVEEVE